MEQQGAPGLVMYGCCGACDVRGVTAPALVQLRQEGDRWVIGLPAPRTSHRKSIHPYLRADRIGLETGSPEWDAYLDDHERLVATLQRRLKEGDHDARVWRDWLKEEAPRGALWLRDEGPGRKTLTLYCPRCRKPRPAIKRRDLWARADHYARAGVDRFLV